MTVLMRDLEKADCDWLLALNNDSVPEVGDLTRESRDEILSMACYARVAAIDDRPLGALIGFWPGTNYQSLNYRWFCERYEHFFYVDRVVVADGARGKGIGRAIYADIERFAKGRAEHIALEVNILPPNLTSLRFHHAAGFVEVGELEHEGGDKKVVMMMKALEGDQGHLED